MIYLDHAASSWPKPDIVIKKMADFLTNNGANPGRGNHRMAREAAKEINNTRQLVAELLHISDPNTISFYMNTTQALNQAIKGLLKPGDHVITSNLEHNSVRRPLEFLKQSSGIEVTYVANNHIGEIDLTELEKSIKKQTKLISISHASNVLGTIQPLKKIGEIALNNNVVFLVDAAQTVGRFSINVKEMNINMLAFPGHKALLGPQGVGGLYVDSEIILNPIIHGGTGSHSEHVEQPLDSPNRYESGTINTLGIVGLGEGIRFIKESGIEKLKNQEWELTKYLLSGLKKLDKITCYGPDTDIERVPLVSFTIDGLDSTEVAAILDNHYEIAVRSGFHCSPLAHQTIKTEASGAIRVSLGHTNTKEEIDKLISSLKDIIMYMG